MVGGKAQDYALYKYLYEKYNLKVAYFKKIFYIYTDFQQIKMEDGLFLRQLGEKIAAIREKKGISQMELARRLETGNNQIRRIEKGLVAANIITLKKIANGLSVDLSSLIKIKE